jgi:hypothetical protein
MGDRGILFSAPMVQAILAGRKTQTRRVAKPRSRTSILGDNFGSGQWFDAYIRDPGNRDWLLKDAAMRPGDTLWVRETWGCPSADRPGVEGGRKPEPGARIVYAAEPADAAQWITGHPGCADFCWRPSIHMPRWASRVDLRCTDVRVERLNDCTEADAVAEGVHRIGEEYASFPGPPWDAGPNFWTVSAEGWSISAPTALETYGMLWAFLHGPEAWDANPLVWVYTFERVVP